MTFDLTFVLRIKFPPGIDVSCEYKSKGARTRKVHCTREDEAIGGNGDGIRTHRLYSEMVSNFARAQQEKNIVHLSYAIRVFMIWVSTVFGGLLNIGSSDVANFCL